MPYSNNSKYYGFFTWPVVVCMILCATVLWWFYDHVDGYGINRVHSVLAWLKIHWQMESNDMDHAWLVPILSGVMLFHVRGRLSLAVKGIDWKGLILVSLGIFIYVAGYRVIQARLPVVALPVILLGCIWYMAGFRVARICAIPVLFLWMMTPMISFQQATVSLQVIATNLGHWGAALFGVDTYVQGTGIFSTHQSWDAYSVSGGCSGMRSLMALIMISIVWAYLANLAVWKKLLLVASAVPLAVLGNAFRITSIVVLAEYVNPAFASKTWHDWSGLLFFFPITLLGLGVVHALLAGEMSRLGKNRRKVVIRSRRPVLESNEAGKTSSEQRDQEL